MWARLWKHWHSAWLMAQRLVESALLDSEPEAELARATALARHKEPPAGQQQTEQTTRESASSQ